MKTKTLSEIRNLVRLLVEDLGRSTLSTDVEAAESNLALLEDKLDFMRRMLSSEKSGQRWFGRKIAKESFRLQEGTPHMQLITVLKRLGEAGGIPHIMQSGQEWSGVIDKAADYIAWKKGDEFDKNTEEALHDIAMALEYARQTVTKVVETVSGSDMLGDPGV